MPWQMQDALEKWARGFGKHAKIEYLTHTDPPTPQVKISLDPDDPRRQAGEQWETVQLVVWDEEGETHPRTGKPMGAYVPIPLEELGTSGLIELLNRTNVQTGRGEYASLQEAIHDQWTKALEAQRRERRKHRDAAIQFGRQFRRRIFDIPHHRVGIELSSSPSPPAEPTPSKD